LQQEEKIAK